MTKHVTVTDPKVIIEADNESFMLRQRSESEIAHYDEGFECGQSGGQNDDTKSEAWQRGWTEAQK
jgi:hypothetical protein